MDRRSQEQWNHDALDVVFAALARSRTVAGRMVFKGARVLNRRLGNNDRQSLDIDANLTQQFLAEHPDPEARRSVLANEIGLALEYHVADFESGRYGVESVTLELKPEKQNHRHGWGGLVAHVRLRDARHEHVIGLPTLDIDIAAPENVGAQGAGPLQIDGAVVSAYTLERMAAEKLRAFLQSLPAWNAKTGLRARAVRVRDLYDLMRIHKARPLGDRAFWSTVGEEFRLACESRAVDCEGMASFEQEIDVTRASFGGDATIPKDWTFDEIWSVITAIVERLTSEGSIPVSFPLPAEAIAAQAG